MIKSRAWGTLLGVLLLVQSAFAAPAFQNGNFAGSGTIGSGWNVVGLQGGGDVAFGQSNNAILGGGGETFVVITGQGTTGGVTPTIGGEVRNDFFSQVTFGATNIQAASSTFVNTSGFSNTARMTGVYQEFTTTVDGSITFDAAVFASAANSGDAFVFLYSIDNPNASVFARGGVSEPGFSPTLADVSGGSAVAPADRPSSLLTRVYGTNGLDGVSYTISNVVAGNYILGFGFGSAAGSSVYGGFVVNNIQVPVPEIDTASAGLPLALALMLFLVIGDRRRRGGVSLG